MNIVVTGAKGMVGTALVNNLKNIRDGKNKTRPNLKLKKYIATIWILRKKIWSSFAGRRILYSTWRE